MKAMQSKATVRSHVQLALLSLLRYTDVVRYLLDAGEHPDHAAPVSKQTCQPECTLKLSASDQCQTRTRSDQKTQSHDSNHDQRRKFFPGSFRLYLCLVLNGVPVDGWDDSCYVQRHEGLCSHAEAAAGARRRRKQAGRRWVRARA